MFYSNIFPQGGGRRVDSVLQVNGVNKHNIYGGPKMEQGGSMIIVHLNAGANVKVERQGPWDNGVFYSSYHGSSFSGFLLQSD